MREAPVLTVIGHIHTPWSAGGYCPKNAMESDETCRIAVDEPYRPGLASLDCCSHAIVLYWLDRAARDVISMIPPNDDLAHGVFALRAPVRPNPIGLSVVDIVKVDADGLVVRHLDCFDGTPLIDIKPYFASTDSKSDARVGWHERRASPSVPEALRNDD